MILAGKIDLFIFVPMSTIIANLRSSSILKTSLNDADLHDLELPRYYATLTPISDWLLSILLSCQQSSNYSGFLWQWRSIAGDLLSFCSWRSWRRSLLGFLLFQRWSPDVAPWSWTGAGRIGLIRSCRRGIEGVWSRSRGGKGCCRIAWLD